jgi:L,D-peptidoglycan transpeptidase YkuD (ErfK/YbiS/YcfS/YnhG family)
VDDPASASYNRIVDEATVEKDWSSAEDMRRPDDLYRLLVVVGHNDAPVTPGGGSCIFLHLRASPGSTTAGCTAFDPAPMEALVRWLDPAKRPVLVQLPRAAYESLRRQWELP